jgi:hypothetical protein
MEEPFASHAAVVALRASLGGAAPFLQQAAPPPPVLGAAGAVGLHNQGGTCYLNALLQLLFATPRLRRALLAWRRGGSSGGGGVPAALQALFARLAAGDAAAASTEGLTAAFGWSAADVAAQHDATELVR